MTYSEPPIPQQHNVAPKQASLRLSNKDGLQQLLDKADYAVNNIYNRRKETIKYFREELLMAKMTSDYFARWTLTNEGHLTIAPPPQPPPGSTNLTFNTDNSGYEIKEYNNLIQYAFKNAIANLKNTERALKMALRYQGEVEISADILNNMDFFGSNKECVKKLDIYCKQTVDKFIKQRIETTIGH